MDHKLTHTPWTALWPTLAEDLCPIGVSVLLVWFFWRVVTCVPNLCLFAVACYLAHLARQHFKPKEKGV